MSEQLAGRSWPGVDEDATLLVPLGSTEQHGPHLPLDTDSRIAAAIATRAADLLCGQGPPTLVAPVLAYGASGEHQGFAGTLSIGTEVLGAVLVELVRSAALTFGRVVLVNGHGGNHQGLTSAVALLSDQGHAVTAWSPSVPESDAHAGRTETSLMLAIAPDHVAMDRAEAGNTAPLVDLIDDLVRGGVSAVSPNGVLGDPTPATAAEGHALLTRLAGKLAAHVRAHI